MDRHRLDTGHSLTPLAYSCPQCGRRLRMRIVWPIWECPNCYVRLIPADLFPNPANAPSAPPDVPAEPPAAKSAEEGESQPPATAGLPE